MDERTDGGQHEQGASARRLVRRGVLLWALFHAAFAAWVLLKPRTHLVFQIGDDAFQTVGGLLAAGCAWRAGGGDGLTERRVRRASAGRPGCSPCRSCVMDWVRRPGR